MANQAHADAHADIIRGNPSHANAPHEDAPHADETHHVVPLSVYFRVFAALMVLLVLTLAVAAVDFAEWGLPWVNIVVAVTVAVVKAVLVILYFMHVRYSSKLVWVFSGAAFVWLVIMFTITFSDYMSRTWIETSAPLSVPQPNRQ